MKNLDDLHDALFKRLASRVQTIEDIEYLERHKAMKEAVERNYVMKLSFFAVLILVVISLLAMATGVDAATPQVWMYIRQGAAGLDFYCSDTPVYEDLREMTEADYRPFALDVANLELFAHVIEVESCNLDNIYENDGGHMFAWRFDYRVTDDHEDHRHFTRGSAWIRLLDFSQYSD